MKTKTILLIHRDPHVREVLHACLTHLGGWQVYATDSAAEALQQASQSQPDAIVLDPATAGMTPLIFLQRLRAQPHTRHIPVVLIAIDVKWINLEPLQAFRLAGILDYSADPAALPQRIARVLGWKQEPLPTAIESDR